MAKPRRKHAPVAAQGGHRSNLSSLDDNTLVKVLVAAQEASTLSEWASLSKQLCGLARSRVPFRLWVCNQGHSGLIIRSRAYGRPPFSGCTGLYVEAADPAACCLAGSVLDAAQQWTALESLQLYMLDRFDQQQQQEEEEAAAEGEEEGTMEQYASSILMRVLPLQHLRHLLLDAPALGACSAQLLLQLTQLTSLRLNAITLPAAAAADLGAMSAMTNLVELRLSWALAPHLPASPEGPYCFPSSLVTLVLNGTDHTTPVPMAHWVAHLPGCPQLQSLTLRYGQQQHSSVHPSHVARLLGSHHTQLRSLAINAFGVPDWGGVVPGLAGAEVPEDGEWLADAALAALTGLQSLDGSFLCVRDQEDWQQLAQLTALTKLGGCTIHYVPPLQGAVPLPLVELSNANHSSDGHGLGRLLLALPKLRHAELTLHGAIPAQAAVLNPALPCHPTLSELAVSQFCHWGDAAAAVAQFGALAPVLSRVQSLQLQDWPAPSSRGTPAMPDLSGCNALTTLEYRCARSAGSPLSPHLEDFLSMVAPLKQLRVLHVQHAPWVTPQVALVLQYMLPQLQCIYMVNCGRLPGAAGDGAGQQQQQQQQVGEDVAEEREVLLKLKRLLRPGLDLFVLS